MRAAIIDYTTNKVTNVILVENQEVAKAFSATIGPDNVGPGWSYLGLDPFGEPIFEPPPEEEPQE